MKILGCCSALVAFVQIVGVLILFYFNINQYMHHDTHKIQLLNAELYHGHYSNLVLYLQVAVEVLILITAFVLLWGIRNKNTKCVLYWLFLNAVITTVITMFTGASIYWLLHSTDPYYEKLTLYFGVLTVVFWNKLWIVGLYCYVLKKNMNMEIRYSLM